MSVLSRIRKFLFGEEIRRIPEYKITIPLTEKNKQFIDSVLRYKLGRYTGLSQEALKKIQELTEKQMKTVKVDVARELDRLSKEKAMEIISKGSPIYLSDKEFSVKSFDDQYLGICDSFRLFKGLS